MRVRRRVALDVVRLARQPDAEMADHVLDRRQQRRRGLHGFQVAGAGGGDLGGERLQSQERCAPFSTIISPPTITCSTPVASSVSTSWLAGSFTGIQFTLARFTNTMSAL